MPTVDAVRARIDTFVDDLTTLIRFATVDAVREAFEQQGRVTGRPAGSAQRTYRAKGAKRDPEVLAELTETLAAHIAKNPGQRIEQIGKALDIATKELVLPVRKLIAAKRVKAVGQKRSTAYHPAGSGAASERGGKAKRPRGRQRGAARESARNETAAAPEAPAETQSPEAASER